MIKSELVARLVARYPELLQADVERAVAAVLRGMTEALGKGGRVEIRGFGTLGAKVRTARVGRNPRSGVSVVVPAKRLPFFRTGKDLHLRLNAHQPKVDRVEGEFDAAIPGE